MLGRFSHDSCEPTDCSSPGSSIHGILQARILDWIAISFSRESSWPRDWRQVSRIENLENSLFQQQHLGFPGGLTVENLPAMQETWVHGVTKSQTGLSNWHTHTHTHSNSVIGLPSDPVWFLIGSLISNGLGHSQYDQYEESMAPQSAFLEACRHEATAGQALRGRT